MAAFASLAFWLSKYYVRFSEFGQGLGLGFLNLYSASAVVAVCRPLARSSLSLCEDVAGCILAMFAIVCPLSELGGYVHG
jgi:hypothetical protein